LQKFTITEEQDVEFKNMINESCQREVFGELCGIKVEPNHLANVESAGSSSDTSSSSTSDSPNSDDGEYRVRATTRTRTLRQNVKLLPMRTAAENLEKDAHGKKKKKKQRKAA
jgi:hypothetical protein